MTTKYEGNIFIYTCGKDINKSLTYKPIGHITELEKNSKIDSLPSPLNIIVIREISRGNSGAALLCTIQYTNKLCIMKISIDAAFNRAEIELNMAAGIYGLSPKIICMFNLNKVYDFKVKGQGIFDFPTYDGLESFTKTSHDKEFVYLMEYIPGISFNRYTGTENSISKYMEKVTLFADECLTSIDMLHKKTHIIHNDLHLGNILMNYKPKIKQSILLYPNYVIPNIAEKDIVLKILDFGRSFKYHIVPVDKNKSEVILYDGNSDNIANKYILNSYLASETLFELLDLFLCYYRLILTSEYTRNAKIFTHTINVVVNILNKKIKDSGLFENNFILTYNDIEYTAAAITYTTMEFYITFLFILIKIHKPKIFDKIVDRYIRIYDKIDYVEYNTDGMGHTPLLKKKINYYKKQINIIKTTNDLHELFVTILKKINAKCSIILHNITALDNIILDNNYMEFIMSFAQEISKYSDE